MDFAHLSAPVVGGAALEAVYWYQLREQLDLVKYKKMLKSVRYWGVTIAMILLGAAVALYWAESKDTIPTPFELLVAGAAAPSLLKNAVTALLSKQETELGADDESVGFRDYFVPAG